MRTLSFLRLPAPAQEDLRRKTVQAVLDGGKVKAIAKLFGITRQSLHRWMSAYHADGEKALLAKKRPKRQGKLLPWQCAQVVRAISDKCPEQLKLPGFWLWTRDAVCQYIESSFGIILSVSTGGRYLRRWGLTPQKPAKRAYQSDSAACKRWMEEEYPAMRHQANREKATILWGDECGFRSDHQTGTSYSKRGKTPVIPATGDRFRCNSDNVFPRGRGQNKVRDRDEVDSRSVYYAFCRHLCRLPVRSADKPHPQPSEGTVLD